MADWPDCARRGEDLLRGIASDQKSATVDNGRAMRTPLSVLIGFTTLACVACAEDHGRSYWLRHASLTLAQAAQIAETSVSGRAVGAQLKQSGTRVFYEVEVVDSVNSVRQVRVDAETGKILKNLTLP